MVNSSRRDPIPPNKVLKDIVMADLDQYDIITLFSLAKKKIGDRDLVITKSGGLWPILLTRLYMQYQVSHDDIIKATNMMYSIIYQSRPSPERGRYLLEGSTPLDLARNFVRVLIDLPMPKIETLVEEAANKYVTSLEKLERRGLILDPDVENMLILSRYLTEPQNKITAKGEKVIADMSEIIENQDSLRSQVMRHLNSLFETFLNEIIMNNSIRLPT